MNESRTITLEEATLLIRGIPDAEMKTAMQTHLDGFAEFVEDETSKIILYEGDVALPYLAIKDDIVIVNGNLTVGGILEDALEVNISLLFVLGNMTVQNLFTFSQICIAGNLTVHNAIVADSTHDYSLHVGGDIKATLIVEYAHTFYVHGNIVADFIYASHAASPRGPLIANRRDEDFIDEVITKEALDLGKALQKIMAGDLIIKNTF